MKGQQHLLDFEDNWRTAMGKWFPGERVVFRGQDLHHDLQDMSWMALFLYGITGRRFSENEMKVFTAIYTYTSFPEPRLWNNRVAALAGSARSTPSLAFGAANAMSEASIYGHKPNTRSIDFFLRTQKKLEAGGDLDEIIRLEMKTYRTIFGYGRPLNRIDERNPAFLKLLQETGLDQGKHLIDKHGYIDFKEGYFFVCSQFSKVQLFKIGEAFNFLQHIEENLPKRFFIFLIVLEIYFGQYFHGVPGLCLDEPHMAFSFHISMPGR